MEENGCQYHTGDEFVYKRYHSNGESCDIPESTVRYRRRREQQRLLERQQLISDTELFESRTEHDVGHIQFGDGDADWDTPEVLFQGIFHYFFPIT